MYMLRSAILVAVCAVVSAGCNADPPSTPPRPTASPPPNPTTLTGISISYHELMLVEGESATLVVTLDSDPGDDIAVQLRFAETGEDDATITPDRLVWTAADWQHPREVEITGIPDEVTERVETHELEVRTYRGAERGPDRHILVAETIQVTLADTRGLITLTGATEGEMVLEWTPADQRTQRWQYREKPRWAPEWSAWLDVPNSDADTRSLRITGLASYRVYFFQVRPWRSEGAGAPSTVVDGLTLTFGADGLPQSEPGVCLERGRKYRVGHFTLVTPSWTIICDDFSGGNNLPGRLSVTIAGFIDHVTGAILTLNARTGEIVHKTFWNADTSSYEFRWTDTGDLMESWKGLPPPTGHDLPALWDEIERSIREEPLPSQ